MQRSCVCWHLLTLSMSRRTFQNLRHEHEATFSEDDCIVQDIQRFPKALDAIIAYRGARVPDGSITTR